MIIEQCHAHLPGGGCTAAKTLSNLAPSPDRTRQLPDAPIHYDPSTGSRKQASSREPLFLLSGFERIQYGKLSVPRRILRWIYRMPT